MKKGIINARQLAIFAMALQLLFPMGYMPGSSFWITICPSGLPDGMLQVTAEHAKHAGANSTVEVDLAAGAEKNCSLSGSITYDSSQRFRNLIVAKIQAPSFLAINNLLFVASTPTSQQTRAPPLLPIKESLI